jgi:hypothetical protein
MIDWLIKIILARGMGMRDVGIAKALKALVHERAASPFTGAPYMQGGTAFLFFPACVS